jgi:hypothetical protein
VVKHGRENGTSDNQDGNMASDFLLVFEQEFDITSVCHDRNPWTRYK